MWRRKKKYPVGKRVYNELYVHKDYIYMLPEVLLATAKEATTVLESVGHIRGGWNVIVLYVGKSMFSANTGFRLYSNFDDDPHPRMVMSYRVDPEGDGVKMYRPVGASYILHRKELLVGEDHPWREGWALTTKQEEKLGMFDKEHIHRVGRESYWNALMEIKGVKYGKNSLTKGSLYYVESGKIVEV